MKINNASALPTGHLGPKGKSTMFRASAVVLLASTILASPVLASDAGASGSAAEAAELQDPIVVVGQREEYGVKSTSTATKTDTDIKDVPQALTVISEA